MHPEKEKINTKKYGALSNFRFVYGNHWQYSKRYVITSLSASPMRALSAVVAAFLPKIVLDCIENQTAPWMMFLKVSLTALLGLVMNLGYTVLDRSSIRDRAISENELYQTMLFRKIADMDYNNFVHNETRVMKEKANQALRGRITEEGTHGELTAPGGRYSEMWNAQAQYYKG